MIFIISQKIALEKMSVAVKRSCANFLQIVLFEHKHVIVYKKKTSAGNILFVRPGFIFMDYRSADYIERKKKECNFQYWIISR